MQVLRHMWDDQKAFMIANLNEKGKLKKSERLRRKRQAQRLFETSDEVRDFALKAYYHYCKENGARCFIEWRQTLFDLEKDEAVYKALRIRRLMNFHKYDLEESIFKIYLEHGFEAKMDELMAIELQIQSERNVPLCTSMFELIAESHAAALYAKSFMDRKKKDFEIDLDDGLKKIPIIPVTRDKTPTRES